MTIITMKMTMKSTNPVSLQHSHHFLTAILCPMVIERKSPKKNIKAKPKSTSVVKKTIPPKVTSTPPPSVPSPIITEEKIKQLINDNNKQIMDTSKLERDGSSIRHCVTV